jgi:soluble cytochrome b562
LKDIVPDHQQSKIRNDSDFQNTFKKGLDRFIEQTGFSVVHGYGKSEPIISEEECLKNLRKIWKKYHQE